MDELRRHHDIGGLPAGSLDLSQHDHAPWEKKVDAILRLLVAQGVMTLDELRRGVEGIGPDAYDRLSYFERWITSISNVLLEKGLLTPAEIGVAIEAVQARHAGSGQP